MYGTVAAVRGYSLRSTLLELLRASVSTLYALINVNRAKRQIMMIAILLTISPFGDNSVYFTLTCLNLLRSPQF